MSALLTQQSKSVRVGFILFLILLSSIAITSASEELNRFTITDFSYIEYGSNGNKEWKLSSEKASITEERTAAGKFSVDFFPGESSQTESISITGKKLIIDKNGNMIIPGNIKINKFGELQGSAQELKINPKEKLIEGKEIKLKNIKKDDMSLWGNVFYLDYKTRELTLQEKFDLRTAANEKESFFLSGKSFFLRSDNDWTCKTNCSLRLEDRWEISAEKIQKDSRESIIMGSGDVILKKQGNTVKGSKFVYNLQNEELEVSGPVQMELNL